MPTEPSASSFQWITCLSRLQTKPLTPNSEGMARQGNSSAAMALNWQRGCGYKSLPELCPISGIADPAEAGNDLANPLSWQGGTRADHWKS